MKKRYWIIPVLIIGCTATFVACSSTGQGSGVNWQKQYPQLNNNVGYGKLVESVSAYQAKTASQQELIGKVTNQFGIRDDVLKLILSSIPESNTRSTVAAIKMAQYDQQQIGVTDDKEMNLIANKASAADSCLDIPMMDSWRFVQAYDKIIRDTPARKAEQYRIEGLLANHVISPDYGTSGYILKDLCDHFLGESK